MPPESPLAVRRVELIRAGLTSGAAAAAAFDAARRCGGLALPEDGPLQPRWQFWGPAVVSSR
ncbi:hypothetical protein [Micromonospora haikouensis]|uniref:hypothetical protein n=1 Tax=Micromonospora haikouensis TaxID=686309 RepID=UPI003D728B96